MNNKVALVTGGTSGIGKEIVKELLDKGCKVITCYHSNEEAAIITKEELNNILNTYGIKIKNNHLYDAAYVANMCVADYLNSSVLGNDGLARFVKDTLDDPDNIDGHVFNRWIADMKWLGIPIPWDEFI